MALSVTPDRFYCITVTAKDYQFAEKFLAALRERHPGFSRWLSLWPGFEPGHATRLVEALSESDPKCLVFAPEAHALVTQAFRVCADRVPTARVKFDVLRLSSDDPAEFADKVADHWHEWATR